MADEYTHVVLSWIWNSDGTASGQLLAQGTEEACETYAATSPKVTSDPREQIIVRTKEQYERALKIRTKEFH